MCKVNILEAKTNFSKLITMLENRDEDEIVVCRSNKPIAKITLVPKVDVSKRIGIARGMFDVPDDIDLINDEIADMFYGNDEESDEWI